VPVADERVVLTELLFVTRVRAQKLDQLPDIKTASDHPGAARPAAVPDPWEQARFRRLLGELLDDGASRASGATGFLGNEEVGAGA
jgi:hypothetical protein